MKSKETRIMGLEIGCWLLLCWLSVGLLSVAWGETLPNPQLATSKSESAMGTEGVWKTYRSVDGLADNHVRALLQDREGAIWFGTEGAVSRYDGNSWKTYTQKDGLANNSVWSILQDKEGAMWFGTSGGVSRYDGNSWKTYIQKDGLASSRVLAILQDKEGSMWFGTNGGVTRFDGRSWETYTQQDGLASNDVSAIAQDKEGAMWFGTSGGVSRFDGVSWKTYTQQDGLADNHVRAFLQDKQGVIWVGTWSFVTEYDGVSWVAQTGGISRFDGKSWKTYTQQDGLVSNAVSAIMEDEEGAIWIGAGSFGQSPEFGGVSRFDGGSWKTYTQQDGLVADNAQAILQDKDGAMWFGTSGGVSRFDGKNWKTYTPKDGLPFASTGRPIIQDKGGAIWIGTGFASGSGSPRLGGVSRFDGHSWRVYTQEDGLASEWVPAILQDRDGTMWFGTLGDGVSQFDGKSWKTYTQQDGLASNNISAIAQDKEGAIWFGTSGGVSRFDGKSWKTCTQEDGLASNHVSAIIQDKDGVMWFGAAGGGVSQYDGKSWKTYTQQDGLAGNVVLSILQDKEGAIWFGTLGFGISRFDGRCFQNIDSRDGLANDSVWCVYQDKSEQIWIGTEGGGVVRFIPNKIPPPVYITEVQADEQTYSRPGEFLRLSADVRRVAFAFHGISFKTRPGAMRYLYQLVGHDDDWQGPTNQETVEYFHLKPGKYTFQVQAVDRDLNYSEPASMSIVVATAPLYQRGAFILSTFGALGSVLLVVSVRSLQRRRQVHAYELLAVRELQDARAMQMGLLPEHAPVVEGAEIDGKCVTANTVGGDFFDYLVGDDHRVGLVVADVSGKAMRGAMNAVMVDGIVHSTAKAQERLAPGLLLHELNDVVAARMESDMNVTMVVGLLDTVAMTLTLANAAHHAYPLLVRNGEVMELKSRGLPLGMRAGVEYREETFDLQPGDILILMTDGIIEAHDSDGNMYGDSGRLERVLTGFTADLTAEAMVDALIQDAIDYSAGEREDDITVVVAKMV